MVYSGLAEENLVAVLNRKKTNKSKVLFMTLLTKNNHIIAKPWNFHWRWTKNVVLHLLLHQDEKTCRKKQGASYKGHHMKGGKNVQWLNA